MRWNKHLSVEGTHAILSCSQNSWVRKTDEEFDEWVFNSKAAEEGTKLHAIAASLTGLPVIIYCRRTDTGKPFVVFLLGKEGSGIDYHVRQQAQRQEQWATAHELETHLRRLAADSCCLSQVQHCFGGTRAVL